MCVRGPQAIPSVKHLSTRGATFSFFSGPYLLDLYERLRRRRAVVLFMTSTQRHEWLSQATYGIYVTPKQS